MRFKKLLFPLAFIAAFSLTSTTVHAVTAEISVDGTVAGITFGNYSFSLKEIGNSGTINYTQTDDPALYGEDIGFYGAGYLPANSVVTFSYTSEGYASDIGKLDTFTYTTYEYDGVDYTVSISKSIDERPDGKPSYSSAWYRYTNEHNETFKVDGYPDPALVLQSAQLDLTNSPAAQIIITNASDGRLQFTHHLAAIYEGGPASMTLTYEVSAVPLPAALPMFALGLLGIAGIRTRRKC